MADATGVEDRPVDGGTECEETAAAGEEIAGRHALQADGTGQGEPREQIGRGDTDPRRGRVELVLGAADVRPAPQQIRRHTGGDLGWSRGDRPRLEPRPGQLARRDADQHAQAVDGTLQGAREVGDLAPGGRDLRLRARHVQLRRESGLHAVAREGEGLFLCLDIGVTASSCCKPRSSM